MSVLKSEKIQNSLMMAADQLFALRPQKMPARNDFSDFNIISHRGQWQESRERENTLKAFKKSTLAPVAGIEFDIRWSADGEPVVFHDQTLKRVFGTDKAINSLSFSQIRKKFPEIPHFKEVVEAFPNHHLMVELKDGGVNWPQAEKVLSQILKTRDPKTFHLMALETRIFKALQIFPKSQFLTIARTDVARMSRLSLENQWGGVTGHYLLMSDALIRRHHEANQIVGVGFPSSLNSLYREVNRGVDYVFTNKALQLYEKHSSRLHRL